MSGTQSAGAKYDCAGDGHIRRRAPSRLTRDCVALEQVRREIAAEYAQLTLDYCSTSLLRLIMSPSSAKRPPSREAPRWSRGSHTFASRGTTAWPPAGSAPAPIGPSAFASPRRPHACSDPRRGRRTKHDEPASIAALDARSVQVENPTLREATRILQVGRPLEPREGLGQVLFQPSLPIAVR